MRATDNWGKNLFIAKYNKDEKYFYVPWDLDGSFGTIWNGSIEDVTDDIITNGFYSRLILDERENGFVMRLTKRWNELRNNILDTERLIQNFTDQINYLQNNGVYERELQTWKTCEQFDQSNVQYTIDWLTQRLNYLDDVFNNPGLLTNVQNVQLSKKTLLKIYPNPANITLNIEATEINDNLESVYIVNNLGATVMNKYAENNTIKIDISDLNSGIYYVVANFRNEVRIIEKLVVN